MKRLIKNLTSESNITSATDDTVNKELPTQDCESVQESNITAATDGDIATYNITDIVDILQQLEELKGCNVGMKVENKALLLYVGDSVYEILKRQKGQYPARKIKKIG